MAALRQLVIMLRTQDFPLGGTDADLFLEFTDSGKSFLLPDQPGNDTESASSTSYIFNVNDLDTDEFRPGVVQLRNDNTGVFPGWRCESVMITGMGQDGKVYPLIAMTNVNRWLAADEPTGLTMPLDVLTTEEVGVV